MFTLYFESFWKCIVPWPIFVAIFSIFLSLGIGTFNHISKNKTVKPVHMKIE